MIRAKRNKTADYTGSSWAYDNLNRMTANGTGTSYSNDILGNRTGMGGSTTYSWDALNRMTGFANSSVTESYVYRADGMRVSKSTTGASTLYRYDGQMGIEDVDTASSATTTTEYGLGARGIDYVAATNGSGTSVSFPIYDAHGNMVATLARSGSSYSIANARDFDPWGNIRGGATTGDPKGRYCANLGHKQDDESGLLYMRARYYDPSSGRFISEDDGCQGWNWYVYAANVPTIAFDASGSGIMGFVTFLAGFLAALGSAIGGHFIDEHVFKLTPTDVLMSLISALILSFAFVTKWLSKGDEAAEKAIDDACKEFLEEPLAEMAGPEETLAEESAAGPAIGGIMFEVGLLEGEMFDDALDNISD